MACFLCLIVYIFSFSQSFAQAPLSIAPIVLDAPVPSFLDPNRRIEQRNTTRPSHLKFLTAEDYPPFHYAGAHGQVVGFNIDLARLICTELAISCTLQVQHWDNLLPALKRNEGDIVIASHKIDSSLRRDFEVSLPVYRIPARFIGSKDKIGQNLTVEALSGKRVVIVGGTAHEAYLNAFFSKITILRQENAERALEAMRRNEADFAFVDGVSGAFWLNGSESLACCAFIGEAYTESRYFGEGAGMVLRKDKADLRILIDEVLIRINRDGRLAKLYLKHFPISFY